MTVCMIPLAAHGQTLLSPVDPLSIEVDPAYPAPFEIVTLRVIGNVLELGESAISWSANGKRITSGTGVRSATVTLGASGTSVSVEVAAISPDGARAVGLVTIRPTEVDLHWSANSYVPPFFRGRALPSAGVTMRAEALTRFRRANGSTLESNELTYTWRRNNHVLISVSGRGKNIVEVPTPPLFGSHILSVTVTSSDDTYRGYASERISSYEPVLLLYHEHPLFGVLTNAAIQENAFFDDREATFTATPYYADTAREQNDYIFNWGVNRSLVPGSEQNQITIRTEGAQVVAQIELIFSHAVNWLQNARNTWNITFEPTTQSGFFGNE